jgi:uncharacterized protein (TIGR03083 family)
MMTRSDEATSVDAIPALSHARWIEIAESINDSFLKLVRDLDSADWDRSTECEGWTVKDIVAHVLGFAEAFTSFGEQRHQIAAALRRRKEFGSLLDAQNQVQVDDRKDLSVEELLGRLEERFPRYVRFRRRVGGIGRFVVIYDPSVLGVTTLHYLLDTILTRDVFMHRTDIARAVERDLTVADGDRVLVADVVRDWARRAKPDARLELTGASGGTFVAGAGTTVIQGDAVQFCRLLSGRGDLSLMSIDGNNAAARRWIETGCPF